MMNSHIQQFVNSYLLPMTKKQLTLQWAKDTYSSFHLFDNHLVYGLTRKTNNLWLIDAEREWVNSHQIEYSYPHSARITETRGFVYKLMNSTFSNTTIKMFKRAMISKLGEYISILEKEQLIKKIDSGAQADLMYEQKTFLNGKGIIIKKKKEKKNFKLWALKKRTQHKRMYSQLD